MAACQSGLSIVRVNIDIGNDIAVHVVPGFVFNVAIMTAVIFRTLRQLSAAGVTAFVLQIAFVFALSAQSSAEAAVRLPVTWAAGTGAPTVRTQFAPMLSLNLGGRLSDATRFSIDTRLSNTPVELAENGVHWSGGTLTLIDVVGTLAWRPFFQHAHHASFEGGLGATVFAGTRDVAPFRGSASVVPIAEATFAYDLPFRFAQNTTALFARATLMRMGGANSEDAVKAPGYVHRASLGVRITQK